MRKTILIVGLGLIGGSLAKAFSEYTNHKIIGIDTDYTVCEQALDCGAIHKIGIPDDLQKTDFIFLCIYPKASVEYIKKYGHLINQKAIVTDVAGIKEWICNEMISLASKFGFTYIGSHPMAGKEKSGFSVSECSLFHHSSYIIVPCNASDEKTDELKELVENIHVGKIIFTTPEEHDKIIAFTSQVPHVLACSYVMSPCCPRHKGFSAGSYRDVSRVAKINEVLWSELFLDNAKPLTDELNLLIENITCIKTAIEQNDKQKLQQLLKISREIKEQLGE